MSFKTNEYFHQNYKILKKLGSGGTSIVYLVELINTKEQFALKLININNLALKKSEDSKEARKLIKISIEREFKLLEKIKNVPNCIVYKDFYKSLIIDDIDYVGIVMEYIGGEDLTQIINCLIKYPDNPSTPPRSIIYKFFLDILTSLKELHSINIVHRDLKPQNILVDKNCNFKLIDFGYSCLINDIDPYVRCKNNIVGTLKYIDPGLYNPYKIDDFEFIKSTDIWSLGVIAYRFTNKKDLSKNIDELRKIVSSKKKIISNYFDENINKLIDYCLEFNYKKRKTSQELYDLLINMINEEYSSEDNFKDLKNFDLKKADVKDLYKLYENGHQSEITKYVLSIFSDYEYLEDEDNEEDIQIIKNRIIDLVKQEDLLLSIFNNSLFDNDIYRKVYFLLYNFLYSNAKKYGKVKLSNFILKHYKKHLCAEYRGEDETLI